MKQMKEFLKNETMLLISFFLALFSAFFVPPSLSYLEAIDFKTLALLFCLMVVMEGFKRLGVFRILAEKLLAKVHTLRSVCLVLCLLCFFSSMIITNDVALFTFVPFTIVALRLSGAQKYMIPIVTLETVSANLGSMLTPIGNPQNLYLFSAYHMEIGTFLKTLYPYALLSSVLIIVFSVCMGNRPILLQGERGEAEAFDKKRCAVYGVLFLVALLTVFHILPYQAVLVVSVVTAWITDKNTVKHVDYSLLFTFIFLFVFIGNLGKFSWISEGLFHILESREVPVAILCSQVLSNVPAAILLSGFTDNAKALLIGTNLGGLGTLIASMASLISFKFIMKENVKKGRYVFFFTWVNVVFLACLLLLWLCHR